MMAALLIRKSARRIVLEDLRRPDRDLVVERDVHHRKIVRRLVRHPQIEDRIAASTATNHRVAGRE